MDTSVSVIIPVYNVEKYIVSCLDSIINQTLTNIEILVVNDGSKDNSKSIIEKYMANDKRIKLINKENGGLSSARNKGIDNVNSKYIYFVDADDFIEKNTLEVLYEKAERDNLDVVVADICIYKNKHNKTVWKDISLDDNQVICSKDYLIRYIMGEGISSVCNKLWKTELYLSNNIRHPENISLGEDGSTLPRLIFNAKRIGRVNQPFYNYRVNNESMTNEKNRKVYQYLEACNIVLEYFENKKCEWIEPYKFTYKYNYAYRMLQSIPLKSKKMKENNDYRLVYNDFLLEVRKSKNKYIKSDALSSKIMGVTVDAYKKSVIMGETIKIGCAVSNIIKNIARSK